MGREFGRITNVNNRVTFGISPFEQRVFPFSSLFSPIPNAFRRITRNLLPVGIPIYVTYYVIWWCKKENEAFNRKNPADYANDQ